MKVHKTDTRASEILGIRLGFLEDPSVIVEERERLYNREEILRMTGWTLERFRKALEGGEVVEVGVPIGNSVEEYYLAPDYTIVKREVLERLEEESKIDLPDGVEFT